MRILLLISFFVAAASVIYTAYYENSTHIKLDTVFNDKYNTNTTADIYNGYIHMNKFNDEFSFNLDEFNFELNVYDEIKYYLIVNFDKTGLSNTYYKDSKGSEDILNLMALNIMKMYNNDSTVYNMKWEFYIMPTNRQLEIFSVTANINRKDSVVNIIYNGVRFFQKKPMFWVEHEKLVPTGKLEWVLFGEPIMETNYYYTEREFTENESEHIRIHLIQKAEDMKVLLNE